MKFLIQFVSVFKGYAKKIEDDRLNISLIKAIGIANQRETTILWDRETGKPLYNAVVWLDSRTSELAEQFTLKTPNKSKEFFKSRTGLPIHPYFSALKIRWLCDNVEAVKNAKRKGTLMFGNVDSWLIWKLTGRHITDVTNASRTLLLDLKDVRWSSDICSFFEIPLQILPQICSSAEIYGNILSGPLKGVPIAGCLGDQQAALVGHQCLSAGDAKNTYGTGTFMLCNIGTKPITSEHGLLTTVAFQFGKGGPVYFALEGSGSIGGNVIRFLRDNFSFIKAASDSEALAGTVKDTDGVYFVPCFSGLYTPYWDTTARGIICGLTQSTGKGHIMRAALEAVCYQTAEMIQAVEKDLPSDQKIVSLKVDGGMIMNTLFNQMQSDLTGIRIICSKLSEITGWGAAVAAAIGCSLVSFDVYKARAVSNSTVYSPKISDAQRKQKISRWKDAVQRSRNWIV